ncbi:MAG: TolC family protein [Phycisphaeraceae bacterium]|nr:TolC family protein [Phycisphaerae bacterium]MBX3391882.1 TolC family protein [Phycisphaeraceae bacterium]HRJ49169.1 TolC family protein [Phycisphaerales bacterium]
MAARLEQYARDVLGESAAGIQGPSDDGSSSSDSSPLVPLDLIETFRLAQTGAREFKTSEEEYVLAAIRVLIERHRWGPRFFHEVGAQIRGSGDDGSYQSAVDLVNELRVTQRLPAGGDLEARWLWNATEHLREQASGRYRQSSSLILGGNIPLLRGAGDIAREDLIQTERDLVYQARTFERTRRALLVSVAEDYFDLDQIRSLIANQVQQIESLREFERQTTALVEAGRKPQFDLNDARNRVLSGVASLANLRERYILQLDRFKVRLGLALETRIDIQPLAFDLPEPDTTIEDATRAALEYRLDLQNERDRVDDSLRAVRNARNLALPDLDVSGNVRLPTDPDAREGGLAFDPEELNYQAGITFGLPLDREIERLNIRQAIIRHEQAIRRYERFRDEVVVSVRSSLRTIDLARFQLRLAEEQVKITEQRREEQLLKADELDTRRRLESEEDLLTARNRRDAAKTALRSAILNYLLQSDQLRVARDGTPLPIPGMEAIPAEPPTPPDVVEFDP